jgi:hypothetical protein
MIQIPASSEKSADSVEEITRASIEVKLLQGPDFSNIHTNDRTYN